MSDKSYIDINLDAVKSSGTAYYRLPDGMYDFLLKCIEKHGIIGFEWDEESRNFGVILDEQ